MRSANGVRVMSSLHCLPAHLPPWARPSSFLGPPIFLSRPVLQCSWLRTRLSSKPIQVFVPALHDSLFCFEQLTLLLHSCNWELSDCEDRKWMWIFISWSDTHVTLYMCWVLLSPGWWQCSDSGRTDTAAHWTEGWNPLQSQSDLQMCSLFFRQW